jgi:Fe-S-cluster containining protein
VSHENGDSPLLDGFASLTHLAELDRQVERGSLFTQATLQRGFARIEGAEVLLAAVVRALAAKGVVSPEELGVTFEEDDVDDAAPPMEVPAGTDPDAPPKIKWPTIAVRVDDPDADDEPDVQVDCAARMHVCQAVCCRLKFPLSAPEVDGGLVKWDIGHPYVIRHESNGMCTHNVASTGGCEVYDHRPGVCRRYSCFGDTRIWKDFDNMVLNQDWIDEHAGANDRDLRVSAALPTMDEPETWDPGQG